MQINEGAPVDSYCNIFICITKLLPLSARKITRKATNLQYKAKHTYTSPVYAYAAAPVPEWKGSYACSQQTWVLPLAPGLAAAFVSPLGKLHNLSGLDFSYL